MENPELRQLLLREREVARPTAPWAGWPEDDQQTVQDGSSSGVASEGADQVDKSTAGLFGGAGLRAEGASAIVSHRGFLLLFSTGSMRNASHDAASVADMLLPRAATSPQNAPPEISTRGLGCPLSFAYLRPGSRRWRYGQPPLIPSNASGAQAPGMERMADRGMTRCLANESGFPRWWLGEHSEPKEGVETDEGRGSFFRLHAPSAHWDPLGRLPDPSGARTEHLSLYFHVFVNRSRAHASGGSATTDSRGVACIGRLTARWLGINAQCEPQMRWQADHAPLFCEGDDHPVPVGSNSQQTGSTPRPSVAARHPHVFRGLDAAMYLLVGGADAVHGFLLNGSSGRLPVAAASNLSASAKLLAVGPAFHLRTDAPLEDEPTGHKHSGDLRAEAARSGEDGRYVHIPGLRRSPRTRLPGARMLGNVEWEFEASRYGAHVEMELPPGVYEDADPRPSVGEMLLLGPSICSNTTGNSTMDGNGTNATVPCIPANATSKASGSSLDRATPNATDPYERFVQAYEKYAQEQRESRMYGGASERSDCKYWCVPGVHCPLERRVAATDDDGMQPIVARYPFESKVVPTHPECRGCPWCIAEPTIGTYTYRSSSPLAGVAKEPSSFPAADPFSAIHDRDQAEAYASTEYPEPKPRPWSELWLRLAGYKARGAEPTQAAGQALSPSVLAVGGRYFLLVSWYEPVRHAIPRSPEHPHGLGAR